MIRFLHVSGGCLPSRSQEITPILRRESELVGRASIFFSEAIDAGSYRSVVPFAISPSSWMIVVAWTSSGTLMLIAATARGPFGR